LVSGAYTVRLHTFEVPYSLGSQAGIAEGIPAALLEGLPTKRRTMRTVALVLDRPAVRGFAATVGFAAVTAVLAQAAVRLPFTPVPVTLQVLAVALAGLFLGSRLGAIAQLEYLAAGLAGVPVFAGGTGGVSALLGPSGGYIPGFVAGAFITGLLFERARRPDLAHAFAAGMAGVAVIYACGAAWLAVWLSAAGGQWPAASAWMLGIAPFIAVDAVKVLLAAMIASGAVRWKR